MARLAAEALGTPLRIGHSPRVETPAATCRWRKMRKPSFVTLLCWLFLCVGSPSVPGYPGGGGPGVKTYYSANGLKRVTVYPAIRVGKTLALAPDYPDQEHCVAKLERKGDRDEWRLVWQRELANPVAPSLVLVAESSDHIVTIDDWTASGLGPRVLVGYSEEGEMLWSKGLSDLIPADRISGLLVNACGGSILWRYPNFVEERGDNLVLRLRRPPDPGSDLIIGEGYDELVVRISDGTIQ